MESRLLRPRRRPRVTNDKTGRSGKRWPCRLRGSGRSARASVREMGDMDRPPCQEVASQPLLSYPLMAKIKFATALSTLVLSLHFESDFGLDIFQVSL